MLAPAAVKPIMLEDIRAVEGLDEYKKAEIVDGIWVKDQPVGAEHGNVTAYLTYTLVSHVLPTTLGKIYSSDTLFIVQRYEQGHITHARRPDVSFVSSERVITGDNYYTYAPDLAVEVISPNDSGTDIRAKVNEYFHAGGWSG